MQDAATKNVEFFSEMMSTQRKHSKEQSDTFPLVAGVVYCANIVEDGFAKGENTVQGD